MGYYPRFLPLCVVTDHSGPNFNPLPYDYECENKGKDFLTHTLFKAISFEEKTGQKGYVIQNPFEWYYKRNSVIFNKIHPEYETFFPVHHLPSDELERFDLDKSLTLVLGRVEDRSKFRVCLHKHDIDRGLHMNYLKAGYNVITAGNSLDDKFVDRFLDILFSSKTVLANHIGSIAFYSALFDKEFIYINDKYQNWESQFEEDVARKLSKESKAWNTELKHSLVSKIYDYNLVISRLKLSLVLYRNLFKLPWIR